MNFGIIRYLFGQVLRFEAGFMSLSLVVSLVYGEVHTALIFAGIILGMVALSLIMAWRKPRNRSFYAKEGLITVSLSWLLISFFWCITFLFNRSHPVVYRLYF